MNKQSLTEGFTSRRGFLRLGGSAACLLGLGALGGALVPTGPALADDLGAGVRANGEGEYTFTPEGSLTEDDIPEGVMSLTTSGPTVVSLGGADRYETSAKEALYAFPRSSTVVVASGAGYADSIAVAGLAGALGCPILLTAPTYVPDVTLSALSSMGAKSIVLLGSESVASASVMSTLKRFGSVERVWGPDRYATQMKIYEYGAKRGLWTGNTAIVASATGFADALAASPVSYALKAPVFFCDGSRGLPAEQKRVLSNELKAANFLLLGSTTVTSAETESFLRSLSSKRGGTTVRLGGADRYATSEAIAQYAVKSLGFTWDGVAFASGQGPYDSLGGGVVQGKEHSVLLLADEVDSDSYKVITGNNGSVSTCLKFFGSTVVVPGEVRAKICSKLHVPYYDNTSFARYGITRSRMAELQVARGEGNGYGYDDFYAALDPDQYEYGTSDFYQFAVLTDGYSGMTASSMNKYVAANCGLYWEPTTGRTSILRDLGHAFVDAAKTHGVNETYLLAHAIWESGWGCSELACGWTPKEDGEVVVGGVSYPYYAGKTYYNFYGIGAVDSNALAGGKAMAVKEGWTSPELAVSGAAKWISDNYLRRSSGAQNTMYLMKWDVVGAAKSGSAWHEYCTGLSGWCTGIGGVMGGCYRTAGWEFGRGLRFSVPVYSGN